MGRGGLREACADDLAARGAGIGTHAELLAVLAKLGIAMDERLGIQAAERICVDTTGREIYRTAWGHTMSAWANVYRPLKDRFPAGRYHFGKASQDERDGSEIVARFHDGSEARGDLLIGADGLRSAVRAQLFPGLEPAYAGYVAWRSIVEESTLSPATAREWLANGYWFVLPPGEMMLTYQVPAKDPVAAPRRRDWNYVWYRPVTTHDAARICTDAAGQHHGLGIPPPLIRPPSHRARQARCARALLAPQIAEIVEHSQPFFQAIFDVESPRLAVGRVALLGDAAFVARPHVGMGVTKGALDALCLADSIERNPADLDAALARYDRLRSEFGRRCVARGRRFGSYIEARSRPELDWSTEQLDQRPERVLHEVAAALAEIPELAFDV